MVNGYVTLTKLVDHAKFEQSMSANINVLRPVLRDLIDAESLLKILHASCSIVHEISELETGLLLRLFLVERCLEIAESKLLVEIEPVDLESTKACSLLSQLLRFVKGSACKLAD